MEICMVLLILHFMEMYSDLDFLYSCLIKFSSAAGTLRRSEMT